MPLPNDSKAFVWLAVVLALACKGPARPSSNKPDADTPFDNAGSETDADMVGPLVCGGGTVGTNLLMSDADGACTLAVPRANGSLPLDLEDVVVSVRTGAANPLVVRRVEAGECGLLRGWHYDHADGNTRIMLCPATCDYANADPDARFELAFGCDLECLHDDDAGCGLPPLL